MKVFEDPINKVPPINEKSNDIIFVHTKFSDWTSVNYIDKHEGKYYLRGTQLKMAQMDQLIRWTGFKSNSKLGTILTKCNRQRYDIHTFYILESLEDLEIIKDKYQLGDYLIYKTLKNLMEESD